MTGEHKRVVSGFLQSRQVVSLSTVNGEGMPHSADLYYASDSDFSLYYASSPRSRHSLDLKGKQNCAFSVFQNSLLPSRIRGIQGHGVGVMLEGEAESAARELYLSRFFWLRPFRKVKDLLERCRMYRVEPDWMRWIPGGARREDELEWRKKGGEWKANCEDGENHE